MLKKASELNEVDTSKEPEGDTADDKADEDEAAEEAAPKKKASPAKRSRKEPQEEPEYDVRASRLAVTADELGGARVGARGRARWLGRRLWRAAVQEAEEGRQGQGRCAQGQGYGSLCMRMLTRQAVARRPIRMTRTTRTRSRRRESRSVPRPLRRDSRAQTTTRSGRVSKRT